MEFGLILPDCVGFGDKGLETGCGLAGGVVDRCDWWFGWSYCGVFYGVKSVLVCVGSRDW